MGGQHSHSVKLENILKETKTEEELLKVFEKYDLDKNGFLEGEEISTLMEGIAHFLIDSHPNENPQVYVPLPENLFRVPDTFRQLGKEPIALHCFQDNLQNAVMEMVDQNDDKKISREEFASLDWSHIGQKLAERAKVQRELAHEAHLKEWFQCFETEDTERMEALLETDVNVDVLYSSAHPVSMLILAASACKLKLVRFLLAHGADPNQQNQNGTSALHFAVLRDSFECVELLLEKGANVNLLQTKSPKSSPFFMSLLNKSDVISLYFLSQVTQINLNAFGEIKDQYHNWRNVTPLMLCISMHKDNLVNFLLKLGADVNVLAVTPEEFKTSSSRMTIPSNTGLDERGRTALHYAAEIANVGAIKALLIRGACFRKNVWGHTPYDIIPEGSSYPDAQEVSQILKPLHHEFMQEWHDYVHSPHKNE